MLLVLEHFKPKLHDLFRSFARRQLPNPADAPVGTGTTRLKERSVWRTQVTQQREVRGGLQNIWPSGMEATPVLASDLIVLVLVWVFPGPSSKIQYLEFAHRCRTTP